MTILNIARWVKDSWDVIVWILIVLGFWLGMGMLSVVFFRMKDSGESEDNDDQNW